MPITGTTLNSCRRNDGIHWANGTTENEVTHKQTAGEKMNGMRATVLARLRGLSALAVTLLILADVNGCAGCRTGLLSECEEAPFVPGYNLAGEGFDVVTMQRKGAYVIDVKSYLTHSNTCTLCQNPFQGGQAQKIPVSVLDWRTASLCKKQLSSALHHSVDSLVRSSASLLNIDWAMGLNLDETGTAVLTGSRSEVAQFARSQFSLDKATFATHEISCTHYGYRLADHPTLSGEFSKYLQRLPPKYDRQTRYLYRRMIDTYGTHFIRQVRLGGRVRRITAFRTCLATLQGFSEREIQKCLDVEMKIALGFLPVNVSFTHKCSSILKDNMTVGFYQGFMTHKIEVMGGEKYFPDVLFNENPSSAYSSWMASLNDSPDVISYSIFPLHNLVSDSQVSDNLRKAVLEYIEENKLEMANREANTCAPAPNLDHNCCPLRAGLGHLWVAVKKAANLKPDYFSQADGFVKVWYNGQYEQTDAIANDNHPVWNAVYDFGTVELGHQIMFEVWEDDTFFDDFLGQCKIYPERGLHSYSCQLNTGVFYFTYRVTCDVHLTGYRCGRYSPGN
ncbi:perforin 1.5 [Conger conger]|uniref:perforin 1.5 n=1 Tax=Conger conger TaxID=82655 RepID=UPI002A59C7CE|nr:perforin 1.5 [Conger conger]